MARRVLMQQHKGERRHGGWSPLNIDDSKLREEVVKAVLSYLADHPLAMDTVKGIGDWWLPPSMGVVAPNIVREAVESLVGAQILEGIGASEPCYRLRSARAP
jgi:hypothetical protein